MKEFGNNKKLILVFCTARTGSTTLCNKINEMNNSIFNLYELFELFDISIGHHGNFYQKHIDISIQTLFCKK